MSSTEKQVLLSNLFFLPNCTGQSSTTMLKRNSKTGHFCLVPDIRKKTFSLSALTLMLTIDVSRCYIRLRKIPSIPGWLKVFSNNGS